MVAHYDALIVGGGHGGAQAALALRQQAFAGTIAIIGRDEEPPYERPPLSKDYLAQDKEFERILIRPEKFWADKQVELIPRREVTGVDPARKRVRCGDGAEFSYCHLVWACGGDARRLACDGAELGGVFTIRCKADADGLIAELGQGARRATIIGGGYIGLEAAAVLTKLGCEVVLIEALDRVLARVAGSELSDFFQQEHKNKRVDLRLSTAVDCILGEDGHARSVRLADGSLVPSDIVIVGIGIVPNVGPLAEAGALVSNGVDVDEFCGTSLPDVYAIGDCAAHASAFAGGAVIRLESVQNATDMATTAAKAICGKAEPYRATPWFWSNQYDLKLQTVGLSAGHDRTVVRGDMASRSFSVIYLREGRVVALDCVNAMKDYVQGTKLVEAGASPSADDLADASRPLKDLL